MIKLIAPRRDGKVKGLCKYLQKGGMTNGFWRKISRKSGKTNRPQGAESR